MAELLPISLPNPVPAPPKANPDVLPPGELVLVDGAPGVGKSRFACLFAAAYTYTPTKDDNQCISLFISSPQQRELRAIHLHPQEPIYSHLREVVYSYPEDSQTPEHLLQFIQQNVREHKPLLLVVDEVEELLDEAANAPEAALLHFWTKLRELAKETNCIILAPRSQGMHENRQYGAFARTGSQCARIIHTLHYHPTNPSLRVLTNVKNQYGIIGTQYRAEFHPSGRLYLRDLAPHQHVRPARQTQTWQPDSEVDMLSDELMVNVVNIMKGKPIRKKVLEAEILKRGYSKRAFTRMMATAKLPSGRHGLDWYYLPSPEILALFKEEQKYNDSIKASQPVAESSSEDQDDSDEMDFSDETPAQRADTKVYDDARKEIMKQLTEIMARTQRAAGGRSETEALPAPTSKV